MEHRFEYQTSEQLKEQIKKKPLVILGIGTVEEHGAHLPLGTDWFITQHFIDDLTVYLDKETDIPFLTLPAIWTGYSAREMQRWPGTITLTTRTVMDMTNQIISSLCEMGFDKILVLNGHGHHKELLRVVAREIADRYNVFPAVADILAMGVREFNEVRRGGAGGSIHGGEDETSILMHYNYDIDTSKYTDVDHIDYHTEYIAGDNYIGSSKLFWSTWGYFKSKTGLLGDPTPSEAATGRVLMEACVKNLAGFIKEYMQR
ncbi:MAG: creatininase family protein [bacterium]|nr:creatininase family protein [bacterium]